MAYLLKTQRQKMESIYFITDEPNELVANLRTPVTRLGKFGDWNNGYGKHTVAILLLIAGYDLYNLDLPIITIDNLPGLLIFNSRIVLFFIIAFYIYKGSFTTNRNILVINQKGILYKEETFLWTDLLSFQVSSEMDMKKQHPVYYLCLRTKKKLDHKINLSMYDKKFDEIHSALVKNLGKYEVKDLGFTQIL